MSLIIERKHVSLYWVAMLLLIIASIALTVDNLIWLENRCRKEDASVVSK